MTQKEFINFLVSKNYSYDGEKTLTSPITTGSKTGRQFRSVYVLGKFNAKRHCVFQDNFKKSAETPTLDYSQLEVVDGKLSKKEQEAPTQEVFERTEGKEMRYCKTCDGAGLRKSFDDSFKPCHSCHGEAKYYAPDFENLIKFIMGRKGLKSAAPTKWHFSFISSARCYFLWRLARFHGGADCTMPCNASMAINGDPFAEELEKASELIAKRVFGTDMAAAYRWANALGGSVTVPDGQPMTAYANGPVVIGSKPREEMIELH